MGDWLFRNKKWVLITVGIMTLCSIYFATQIKFVFDFERYFPEGDEDLAFFYEFREEFEDDDNFLLIAFSDSTSIFNQASITRIDSFTQQSARLPNVRTANSITNFFYFRKFPLGGFSLPYPAIQSNQPARFKQDSIKLMADERIYGNLIAKNAKSAVVALKTITMTELDQSNELMEGLNKLLIDVPEDNYHILGRAYFQEQLVKQQTKEIIVNTIISAVLVLLVFWAILRKPVSVGIALLSMVVSLIIFLGLIGLFQIEMDLLSSLFPIVMIIVGVSDVVHLMTKYIDEYERTGDQKASIKKTVREIGLATFLTSFTTAIGFLTLITSNIYPVRLFGTTAALGVITAFAVVLAMTSSLLAYFKPSSIIRSDRANTRWMNLLSKFYYRLNGKAKYVLVGSVLYLIFCAIGISKISTDIQIFDTLPKGLKVTNDFKYFEENFAGFRPLEVAILLNEPYKIDDYEVLNAINEIETHLNTTNNIEGASSITAVYKSINRAMNGDEAKDYFFPESRSEFESIQKFASIIPQNEFNILVNADRTKTRIAAKVKDIGTERINKLIEGIYDFKNENINPDLFSIRVTGTGVIFDKNNVYLRQSIIVGLGIAFLIISLIMALLFRSFKMVVISLIPNIFPLLFGGALMGYFNIPLDAPTAIIFAIAFGIAVDDTIHFLSKYKIERLAGKSMEDSLHATVTETGKAIIITSIILFFGFMILIFSKTIGIVFVGILVSGTLFSAVVADLVLIPPLIRYLLGNRDQNS